MKILITGSSSGIGRGAAEYFLARGHEVIGFDRLPASLAHKNYIHYVLDIRDRSEYPPIEGVEVLINCAGVQNEPAAGRDEKDAGCDPMGIDSVDIETNLKGTIYITERYGIQPSIRSVVMVGSASGHTGSEFPLYSASKGGVLAYTKNVALRIAPYGAVCNSLDFGGVTTELNKPVMEDEKLWNEIMELTPLKRWMSVEETAEWIYFMGVTNRFCSGQNILIDGLEAGNAHFVWPET